MFVHPADFYREKVERLGKWHPDTVSYTSSGFQFFTMKELTKHLSFRNLDSVLDVGAGRMDLLDFIANGIDINYTAVDLSKDLLDIGLEGNPEAAVYVGDYGDFDEALRFDYVLANGPLHYASMYPGHELEWIDRMVGKMYRQCRRACAFTVPAKALSSPSERASWFCPELSDVLKVVMSNCDDFVIEQAKTHYWVIVTMFKVR